MFIRSQRLFLRPIWPEDWRELKAGADYDSLAQQLSGMSVATGRNWQSAPPPREDPRCPRFLITRPDGIAPGAESGTGLERGSESGRAIGCVGLVRGGEAVRIGYWIAPAHQRHGYATEAARAMLTLARVLGHRRIGAAQIINDPGAGRVLTKLGFRPLGAPGDSYFELRGVRLPVQQHVIDLGAASDSDYRDDGGGGGLRAA